MHTKKSVKSICRSSETGRSMVEVLAVLAIVGVLSVAGIMGYRYAMNKHRITTIANELNMLRAKIALIMEQPHAADYHITMDSGYPEIYAGTGIYTLPQIPNSWLMFSCTASPYATECTPREQEYSIMLSLIPRELCAELSALTGYFPQLETIQADCTSAYSSITYLFKTEFVSEQAPAPTPEPTGDLAEDAPLPPDPESAECTATNDNSENGENPDNTTETENPECQCFKSGECGEGDYCHITVNENSGECITTVATGTCIPSSSTEVPGTPYVVSMMAMTWWSANQFCESIGKQMVPKSEITPEIRQIFKDQGLSVWFKTRKEKCRAYYYAGQPADNGEAMDINKFGNGGLNAAILALCK